MSRVYAFEEIGNLPRLDIACLEQGELPMGGRNGYFKVIYLQQWRAILRRMNVNWVRHLRLIYRMPCNLLRVCV
jgi:hypothetical protein